MGAINSIKAAHIRTSSASLSLSRLHCSEQRHFVRGGPALPLTFSHIDIDHALTHIHTDQCYHLRCLASVLVSDKKSVAEKIVSKHTHTRRMHVIRCIVFWLCQCGQNEIEVQDGTKNRRKKRLSKSQTRRDVIQEIESEVEIETDSSDKINRTEEWSNVFADWASLWATTMGRNKYIACRLQNSCRSRSAQSNCHFAIYLRSVRDVAFICLV